MAQDKQIRINQELRDLLKKKKMFAKETYAEVIERTIRSTRKNGN